MRMATIFCFALVMIQLHTVRSEEKPASSLPTVIYDEPHPKIPSALKQAIPVDFQEMPLRDVVSYLTDATGVPILLDQAGLGEGGMDGNAPITLQIKEVSLQDVLSLMLEPYQLDILVKKDYLIITNRARAQKPEIRLYPVIDLVRGARSSGSSQWLVESHIEVIQNAVDPDQWEENGGQSTIEFIPSTFTFAVSASPRMHEKIEGLLKLIRASRGPTEDWAKAASVDIDALRESLSNLQARNKFRGGGGFGGGGGGGFVPQKTIEATPQVTKTTIEKDEPTKPEVK